MNVIVIQDEAYQQLVKDFEKIVKEALSEAISNKVSQKEWLDSKEAMGLLGFRSKSKMQSL